MSKTKTANKKDDAVPSTKKRQTKKRLTPLKTKPRPPLPLQKKNPLPKKRRRRLIRKSPKNLVVRRRVKKENTMTIATVGVIRRKKGQNPVTIVVRIKPNVITIVVELDYRRTINPLKNQQQSVNTSVVTRRNANTIVVRTTYPKITNHA